MKKNKYWFKPKRYGWGVYPVSWQGWLATLVLLNTLMLVVYVHGIGVEEITRREIASFILDFTIVIAISIVYFNPKTKGRLRWRWGK